MHLVVEEDDGPSWPPQVLLTLYPDPQGDLGYGQGVAPWPSWQGWSYRDSQASSPIVGSSTLGDRSLVGQ